MTLEPNQKTHLSARPLLASLAIGLAIGWLALSASVPLTYDEAWNTLHVARLGVAHVLSNYQQPNNHILFSLLQSSLGQSIVTLWPPALRLWNVVVGWLLIATLGKCLKCSSSLGPWSVVGLSACLLLCSPLVTTYLFVARGYLLGTWLLLLAAMGIARGRAVASGICVGLATATLPTFAYALPGLAWVIVLPARPSSAHRSTVRSTQSSRTGAALRLAAGFGMAAAPFYAFAFRQVLAQRHGWTAPSLGGYSLGVLTTLGCTQVTSILLLGLLACFTILGARSDRSVPEPLDRALIAAALSFVLMVAVGSIAGLAWPPFLRNGLFVPLFLWLALLLRGERAGPMAKTTVRVSAVLNGVLGLGLFANAFLLPASDPDRFREFASLSPTPAQGLIALHRDHRLEGIEAAWAATPVAELYAQTLAIPLAETESPPPNLGQGAAAPPPPICAVGAHPPADAARIWAVSEGRRLQLCF